MSNNKVLAIASTGGHYVQLTRLIQSAGFDAQQVVFVRTKVNTTDAPSHLRESLVEDISRDTLWRIPVILFQIVKSILVHNPKWIVTTGALPGLVAIIVGRLMFKKTLWIDSIANTKTLSASGNVAKRFAHITLTQWENVASGEVIYRGKVI